MKNVKRQRPARHSIRPISKETEEVGPAKSLRELIALDRPVTIREVAEAVPVLKESTLAQWLREREIPGVKIGRSWLIKRQWLIELQGETPAQDSP